MVTRRDLLASLLAAPLAGCLDGDGNGQSATAGATPESATPNSPTSTDSPLTVTSPAFDDGASIPARYARDGAEVSPPLTIRDLPTDAQSLALVADDPDAPDPPFTHWLVWGISPDTEPIPSDLPQTERLDALDGAVQGENDFGELGYGGPLPPPDDDPHRYRFTVSALASPVDLLPGSTRAALDDAIAGARLATGRLVGTYER